MQAIEHLLKDLELTFYTYEAEKNRFKLLTPPFRSYMLKECISITSLLTQNNINFEVCTNSNILIVS